MRWFALCLGLSGVLGAQASFRVVAVERRGPPPYEPADRVYQLDGGAARGLQVGARLKVKRPGAPTVLGHLRVTELRGDRAEARFEPQVESSASTYPMKGDLALLEELKWMPGAPPLEVEPMTPPAQPLAAAVAPPREGLLYFLPQRADLSPAGQKKLETWVQAWGAGGRWAVLVPTAKALKPALQKQRADTLQAALRALGVAQVAVERDPRTADGKHDPAWIRHWD